MHTPREQSFCSRLDPEQRICPQHDSVSIRKFRLADRKHMGMQVLDNFCEEHIE